MEVDTFYGEGKERECAGRSPEMCCCAALGKIGLVEVVIY
jgi:hypothetical protein